MDSIKLASLFASLQRAANDEIINSTFGERFRGVPLLVVPCGNTAVAYRSTHEKVIVDLYYLYM